MAGIAEQVFTTAAQAATLNENFYLSPGVTWQLIRSENDGGIRPLPKYFLLTPVIAVAILIARFLFERFVALPVGRYLNVSESRPTPPEPNAVLEKAYKMNSKPEEKLTLSLARSANKPVRFVERWFRRMRSASLPNTMRKFQEALWRFFAYSCLLLAGFCVILNKDFWTDTRKGWLDYPYQSMPADIFWYYIVELSFYLSLTASQFLDIKRKDFWQMFLHHVVTILLISFSFATNYFALGSCIMFVHDIVDPLLELAKVLSYCRQPGEERTKRTICGEGVFIAFMLLFFYTRLYLFPTHCIQSSFFEMREMLGPEPWPMWGLFNILLSILYGLHWFWSLQIVRVARESIISGTVKRDVRSCDENSSEEDTANKTNGDSHSPGLKAKMAAGNGVTNGHAAHGGKMSQRR